MTSGASLRTVMASFPTGVTIVGARTDGGDLIGLTVNSFASVSLDPPLVLICIGHRSGSHDPIIDTGGFTVSVLSAAQEDVAVRFSTQPSEGRFEEHEWTEAPSGHPVIVRATAWLDCTIQQVIEAGDHSILVALTTACGWGQEPALIFHRGVMASSDG